MKTRVIYFGKLKDYFGSDPEVIEIDKPCQIQEFVARRFTDKGLPIKEWEPILLYAINHTRVFASDWIQPGDELAIMPPLAGG